jgi:hypothetical protein
VLVIEALWERFGIGKELRAICKAKKRKAPYDRALLAMVVTVCVRLNPGLASGTGGCPKSIYLPNR